MSTSATQTRPDTDPFVISLPAATDAAAVHDLIARCRPLDSNSLYCNLLQCTHFAATCALARNGDHTAGFVSGYRPPADPGVLFIWQVAVDATARGHGLAQRLIRDILARESSAGIDRLHTTVTPSNEASRAMFRRLAESLAAPVEIRPHFDRHIHLADHAETEELFSIGPFTRPDVY